MIGNKKWILGCSLYLLGVINIHSRTGFDNSSSSEGIGYKKEMVAFPSNAFLPSFPEEMSPSDQLPLTTTLSVGDIAILKITADDPDDYTFITFVDILAGTKIYFTDCGVTSSGNFGSNPSFFPNDASACSEGADLYTVPSGGLSAGDIVTWSTSPDFTDYTDAGMRRNGGGTNISTGGDQILVFQDGDGSGGQVPGRNPKYIFIAHTSSTVFTGNGSDGTTQSHLPTGLSASNTPRTAVGLGMSSGVKDEWDNVVYSGTYDFSSAGNQAAAIAAAKVAMTNPSNFIKTNDRNASNYTAAVSSIPAAITTVSAAPSSLQVAATVYLEGAYNGANLTTAINSSIPAQQPYNGVNSHNQTTNVSIPANAVDWVLVELREAGTAATATNGTRKGSTAGFLMNDGTIKATDGSSNLTINLSGNTGTDYYVVVYHRNHLPIMSAAAIDGSGGTLTIDFTSNSANTYQTTTALVSLSNNKFGMPAGDTNGSGTIDGTDLNTWQTNNGAVFSYSNSGIADFNLDGEINAVDRNDFQQKNTSKTRQVPTSTL